MLVSVFLYGINVLFSLQGVLYGTVGFGCGIIGQGIANLIMTAKRYTTI